MAWVLIIGFCTTLTVVAVVVALVEPYTRPKPITRDEWINTGKETREQAYSFPTTNQTPSGGGGTADGELMIIVNAKALIKERVKSPSTLKFPWLGSSPTRDGVGWRYQSYFDAQNSFGGTVRTHFVVHSDHRGNIIDIDLYEKNNPKGSRVFREGSCWGDVTSEDIGLTFQFEKTTFDGTNPNFWGKVTNTSKQKYEYVKVIFTAYDNNGEFLGRHTWFCEPSEIGPGQVGYIEDKFVRTEGRRPVRIVPKVIGRQVD